MLELQSDINSATTDLVLNDLIIPESPIGNSSDITFAPKEAPQTELLSCDNNFIEQSTNTFIEAANQLTDAIAKFLTNVNTNNNNNNNDKKLCGLLQFKEWWELVGVNICVNGEQISGIPISIKEDAIRVIDNDYSYFIPLEKVDYIRTNDGLLTDFKLPNNQPI